MRRNSRSIRQQRTRQAPRPSPTGDRLHTSMEELRRQARDFSTKTCKGVLRKTKGACDPHASRAPCTNARLEAYFVMVTGASSRKRRRDSEVRTTFSLPVE
jgi:hypothetical protein